MTDKTAVLLILAAALTNASASTIMKHAYNGEAILSSGIFAALFRIAFNPWSLAGILLFGVSFFFMAAALSRTDLTFAYPLMSAVVYLLLIAVGVFVFHEKITWTRIAGMAFILAGIAIIVKN